MASEPQRRDPLADRAPDEPHPSRLATDRPDRAAILAAHAAALTVGAASYRDPATGLHVHTASALADRGWCCESGCRHCPYVT